MTVEIRSAPMTAGVTESIIDNARLPYSAAQVDFSEMRARQRLEDRLDHWRRTEEGDPNAKEFLAIVDGVSEIAIHTGSRASADGKVAQEDGEESRAAKREANEEERLLEKGARTKVVERDGTAVRTDTDDSYFLRASAHAVKMKERSNKSKERAAKSGADARAAKQVELAVKKQITLIPVNPERETIPTPRAGDYQGQFAQVGNEMAKLLTEAKAITQLMPAPDELTSQLDRIIDAIPSPKITIHRSGLRFEYPMKTVHGTNTEIFQRVVEGPVAAKFLDPDGFRKRAHELLADTLALEGGESISAADREKRLADIADRLFDLGLKEEGIVRAARAEGIELMRHGEADPRCVLGVSRKYRRAS